MYDFKEMRARLALWHKETHLDASELPAFHTEHEVWKEALADNTILFSSGVNGRHKYASFKDIDFTGPEYNNQEWRAQLNRFFWMPHLAYEYDRTHDEHWALLAREGIEHWIDCRPNVATDTLGYAWNETGDNCLSLSLRLGQGNFHGWFGSLPYFEGSKYFDQEFMDRIIASTKDQLIFLMRWLTKHGNFRISQCHTMLFLSRILPEHFSEYGKIAVAGLNEAFRLQVEPDGSHVEHTVGYHTWMQRVFTEFAILAKNAPELGLDIPAAQLLKMYDYELANYTPDGRIFGLNDTGRWYEGKKGADVAARYAQVNRLRAFFGFDPIDKCSFAFPDAGQYFFKSGDDALCLDSTKYYGYHTHIVRNAVLFYHGDRLQICEPGSLNYERSDPFCHYGRISPMHNTVTVNDWNQSQYADAVVPVCVDNDDLSFIISRYGGGYSSTAPLDSDENKAQEKSCTGSHNRVVLWLKGKFAIVYDTVKAGVPNFDFAAHWQFLNETVVVTENGMHTASAGANVLVCSPWSNCEVKPVLYNGNYRKMIGFISPDGSSLGSGSPAPMLSVEGKTVGYGKTAELLTVIAPFEGSAVPEISAGASEHDGILRFEVTADGETWHFAIDSGLISGYMGGASVEEVGGVKSDARAAVLTPDGTIWEY